MENNSGRKLVAVVLVVIVLAVILAIWLSVRNSGTPPLDEFQVDEVSFRQAQNLNRDASMEVPDQFPGSIVYVSRANFPAGGWVVIRGADTASSTVPGDIIGFSFFDKDTRIGNIDLVEPTVDGGAYFAQGFTDDGDAKFNGVADRLIENRDGQPLQVSFIATKDLPERKD